MMIFEDFMEIRKKVVSFIKDKEATLKKLRVRESSVSVKIAVSNDKVSDLIKETKEEFGFGFIKWITEKSLDDGRREIELFFDTPKMKEEAEMHGECLVIPLFFMLYFLLNGLLA